MYYSHILYYFEFNTIIILFRDSTKYLLLFSFSFMEEEFDVEQGPAGQERGAVPTLIYPYNHDDDNNNYHNHEQQSYEQEHNYRHRDHNIDNRSSDRRGHDLDDNDIDNNTVNKGYEHEYISYNYENNEEADIKT